MNIPVDVPYFAIFRKPYLKRQNYTSNKKLQINTYKLMPSYIPNAEI